MMGDKQQLATTMSARVQALADIAYTDAQRAWAEVAHQGGVLVVDRLGTRSWAEYARSSNTGVTGAVTATGTAVRVEAGTECPGAGRSAGGFGKRDGLWCRRSPRDGGVRWWCWCAPASAPSRSASLGRGPCG